MLTQAERAAEKRGIKLAEIRRQVKEGSLRFGRMTAQERKRFPLRPGPRELGRLTLAAYLASPAGRNACAPSTRSNFREKGQIRMASSHQKKTTMAKLNREAALRERRQRKQARKDARKQASRGQADRASGTPGSEEPGASLSS